MQRLIVANWKMHGSLNKVKHDLKIYAENPITNNSHVVISLPSVFLSEANNMRERINARYQIAAQDVSQFKDGGAYTGEVSAAMLKDFNVSYVIVGHSERRTYFNESGSVLTNKLDNCLSGNIKPIFCIGEQLAIRQNGTHLHFLSEQLELLLQLKVYFNELIIAYEPVWSIGSGVIPQVSDISQVVHLISAFMQNYLPHVKITVLYGGSVSEGNAKGILNIDGLGGLLVGGASLFTDRFTAICSV